MALLWETVLKELPDGYSYHHCEDKSTDMKLVFHVMGINSEVGVMKWLGAYSDKSRTTWRARGKYHRPGNLTIFRVDRRCHHHVKVRSATADARRSSKNTNCPAWIKLSVRAECKKHIAHAVIELHNSHNHQTDSSHALSKRDVSKATREKLLSFFADGYGPAEALHLLKFDLQQSCSPEEYTRLSADRALVPDAAYTVRLHSSTSKGAYGAADTSISTMSTNVEKKLSELKQAGVLASKAIINNELIVACVSPLMLRAHSLPQSGELVFLDATGNSDRNNCRVFLLMTFSKCGGIPLGCFITTSEAEAVIGCGLQMVQNLVGMSAFADRGDAGPRRIMTDDCDAEGAAIRRVWPFTDRLLCTFHLAQATWRWLRQPANGVSQENRQQRMQQVQQLIFSGSPETLDRRYAALQDEEPKFVAYVSKLMERREQWAHCYRDMPHHTNNIVEAAFRILKDVILNRTRAYNISHLLEFVACRMERYYSRKYVDIANGRYEPLNRPRQPASMQKIDKYIYQTGGHTVNVQLKACDCGKADCGAISMVDLFHDSVEQTYPTLEERQQFHWLATGVQCNPQWLDNLREDAGVASTASAKSQRVWDIPTALLEQNDLVQNRTTKPPDSSAAASLSNDEMEQLIIARAHSLSEKLTGMLTRHTPSSELLKAMESFNQRLDQAGRTSCALISFLHGATSNTARRGAIPVQPTATSRRRMALGRGCRRVAMGRPVNAKRTPEHGFARSMLKRKRSAPHDLSYAVEQNISLVILWEAPAKQEVDYTG